MPYVDRNTLHLSDDEVVEFVASRCWARIGTASPDGEPHVTPVGYIWYEGRIYVQSLTTSRRSRDLAANGKVALCVDEGVGAGDQYTDRRGVLVYGVCRPLDRDAPVLDAVRPRVAERLIGDANARVDRRTHTWYEIEPTRWTSWDFGRIPAGADPMVPDGGADES